MITVYGFCIDFQFQDYKAGILSITHHARTMSIVHAACFGLCYSYFACIVNVNPKGPPDGYGLPFAMKWAGFVPMGLLVQIFVLSQYLCIYPHVKACAFFICPSYF